MPEERVILFRCGESQLIGILHVCDAGSDGVVLLVVGGPQYRAGSHRMFVQLARALAANGVPALRFDCRGMGDSDGVFPGFESIGPDIRSAIDAVGYAGTTVTLIGLCDGATAASLYAHTDSRVKRLVLINPWVHTAVGEAQAKVVHYYGRRFVHLSFWRDLFSGRIAIAGAVTGLFAQLRAATTGARPDGFIDDMLDGLQQFAGPIALILSGQDLTAQEFDALTQRERAWTQLIQKEEVVINRCRDADHTFSEPDHMAWLSEQVLRVCVGTEVVGQ